MRHSEQIHKTPEENDFEKKSVFLYVCISHGSAGNTVAL